MDMVKGLETMLKNKTNEVMTAFRRDLHFMGNREVTNLADPMTPETLLRKEVLRIINDAEALAHCHVTRDRVDDDDDEANKRAAKVESCQSQTKGPAAQKNT